MPFRVSRTIQVTIDMIVDHEDDAVAIAMTPLTKFVEVTGIRGRNIKERGAPAITPTTERSEER